jgi:hypothetical protein
LEHPPKNEKDVEKFKTFVKKGPKMTLAQTAVSPIGLS